MFAFMLTLEAGDKRDKLEELYITYRKELYYVAYQILHNHYDAEDVIQNAFLKVAKFIDKINEIECKKTRAYLVIIVRRLCFDRYNEKKKTVPIDFMDETEEVESNHSSLDDHVLQLERGRELAESLSKINSGYADILTLKYFYELSNDEIGELINLSPQNVSVKLTRAKIALRNIITEGENKNG
jgi:RNA polymerase sigma-70 factor (ECF subfamily)